MKIFKNKLVKWGIIAFAVWLVYQIIFSPNGSEFIRKAPGRSSVMKLQEEDFPKNGITQIRYSYVPLSAISPYFRLAVLSAEDSDFESHSGFAWNEMYNSIASALKYFRIPRGASTITQQLAKNLYLSPSKNPLRKIKEAIITFKLEGTLSKRRILELYLNIVELGPGVFGAEAASKYWFSKSASSLTAAESAKLAAILPGPNTAFNPVKYPKRVAKRQQILLGRMQKQKLPNNL